MAGYPQKRQPDDADRGANKVETDYRVAGERDALAGLRASERTGGPWSDTARSGTQKGASVIVLPLNGDTPHNQHPTTTIPPPNRIAPALMNPPGLPPRGDRRDGAASPYPGKGRQLLS